MIEQELPQSQPDDTSSMSMMEIAVSRGVEAALRRIFVEKDPPTIMKQRSPRRKKMQKMQGDEVRKEKATESSHERDFLLVG